MIQKLEKNIKLVILLITTPNNVGGDYLTALSDAIKTTSSYKDIYMSAGIKI